MRRYAKRIKLQSISPTVLYTESKIQLERANLKKVRAINIKLSLFNTTILRRNLFIREIQYY